MKRITKQQVLNTIAGRWRAHYCYRVGLNGPEHWRVPNLGDARVIYNALLTAGTEEAVTQIIGNDNWTKLICDECKRSVDTLVQMGDGPDYESSTALICIDCLEEAVGLLSKSYTILD